MNTYGTSNKKNFKQFEKLTHLIAKSSINPLVGGVRLESNIHIIIRTTTGCLETTRQVKRSKKNKKEKEFNL